MATGLMLLPFSVAVIAGSTLAAPALRRWPPQRLVSVGLAAIAVSDAGLIPAVDHMWAVAVCVALAGAGIGLSSVAATGLGTSVPVAARGTASGIINTAAQLGTAVGIAVVLLVAAWTTGIPESGSPEPAIAWGAAALIGCTGALLFGPASAGTTTASRRTADARKVTPPRAGPPGLAPPPACPDRR